MKQIKAQIEETTSDYDREKLQERLAKLAGGVAVIKVGGATEVEVKERKDRVEDALHATRAAVEEGIVPGGGVALLRAIKNLESLKTDNDDQRVGINIVRKALQTPARQIFTNAGEDGSVIVGKIMENSKYAFGYNAQTSEFGDLVTQGVIDPAKVVRAALQDAASIAGLLITTEAMVAELPKKDSGHAHPPMGGGGMGGMDLEGGGGPRGASRGSCAALPGSAAARGGGGGGRGPRRAVRRKGGPPPRPPAARCGRRRGRAPRRGRPRRPRAPAARERSTATAARAAAAVRRPRRVGRARPGDEPGIAVGLGPCR